MLLLLLLLLLLLQDDRCLCLQRGRNVLQRFSLLSQGSMGALSRASVDDRPLRLKQLPGHSHTGSEPHQGSQVGGRPRLRRRV